MLAGLIQHRPTDLFLLRLLVKAVLAIFCIALIVFDKAASAKDLEQES